MQNKYLNTTTYTIYWFKKIHDAEELEIKPPFQRNPVWTLKQKSLLIDSILRGFPIPEIYLQELATESGVRYAIIDGQQRIRSVLDFIAGEFSIEESESENWRNFYFDDLSEIEKKDFMAYKFAIRSFPDSTDEEIRAIFQRINKNNVVLNPQELRQATYSGSFIQSVNAISDKDYWDVIGIFTSSKIRRMEDAEYISELIVAYLNGAQNKKIKLDQYYQQYELDYPDREAVESLFDRVVGEIIQVLPNIRDTRWRKVVDFYALFLVLSQYSKNLPLPSEKRARLGTTLTRFSEAVDSYQASMDRPDFNPIVVSENVKIYASGIRNSSDLASRKARITALQNEIKSVLDV